MLDNESVANDAKLQIMLTSIEKARDENWGMFTNITKRVGNNTNIMSSLTDRFDTQCTTIKDVFLRNMQNDKLIFYFRKRFQRRPRILMMFRNLRLKGGNPKNASGQQWQLTYEIKDDKVEEKSFRYSIRVIGGVTIEVESLEICYIAFEDVRFA